MGVTSDVGIAVTLEVDKLMRETLKAVAHGEEAIQMLDDMFEYERDGWKLYHHGCMKWYIDVDPVIKAVHDFLTAAVDGDFETNIDYQECITYMVLTPEFLSTDNAVPENHGYQSDPFNLGYTFKLEFEPKPTSSAEPAKTSKKKGKKTK